MAVKINGDTYVGDTGVQLKQISTNKTDIANIKGTTLYSNSSGSNGTITLSDNVSNYRYLVIFYNRGKLGYNSTIVDTSQSMSNISLTTSYIVASDLVRIYSKTVSISGNTITVLYAGVLQCTTSNTASANTTDSANQYITKVIGYK